MTPLELAFAPFSPVNPLPLIAPLAPYLQGALELAWKDGFRTGAICGLVAGLILGYLLGRDNQRETK